MKVIPKLQQGNTIESDNTKVVRPEIHEPIKAKPRQYSIVDLGGEPSNDTRSAAERNRDYWHPIKGARDRFKASMSNETNPLVGIERTILPSAAGAALVTTPAAVVGGALGNMTVDKLTGGWGNWLENKTGIPSEIGIYTNPGAWYGGAKGYKIGKDKLITKSIKGDADLAWNPINKNHWIFNKEARTPLLKKQEEINGKRDMRKKFIKSSRPTYKKRIKKAQQGMRFASYNVVETPRVDITDITNPINPFSEYNYNTTYDKPTALVVPAREEVTPVKLETPEIFPKQTPADNDKFDVIPAKSIVKSIPLQTWKSPYTNRKQWATELINAYKKAGITNDNAIRMLLAQDALESSWGKSAQGKYNFGNLTTGSSWKGDYVTGNDKNAKGEAIKQKFRSYNSMDEYAADKIQFLKRLYDFDENDDINKFVAKLTGSNKGKRRYAEATNYAKVLTGVYNGIPKGENGMIIKYQNPPHGIARRDAIQDYRPEIPFSPIKQPVKPYMPTQQPILSPDNRTGWEKEVSRQIKADRAKNDNLYGNQHTWNWSAPFTNARITKDNASAMFDFDKSAAMSTFAIGQGIASPVTTATSIAGSLVGAGIGNKIAGNKGALIGGFVGGMVNPNIRFGKSSSTKRREHGNVADNVNLHSKMNFDDYDQIVNAIDNEEELYRLYLQNETVAKRIREVSPSYVDEVANFIKTKIKTRFGKPTNENYQAVNRVASDAPEVTFGGVPFKYQENVYNIEPGKPIPHLEFVAHENSHGIDRAMSRLLSTDYLRNLLNPNDKLPFNKWINEVKKSKAVVDYIKRISNLDVNNPADYSKIEKEIYEYFSKPTEIKAYFSRIPFEKYKKSVDRSFDGKVINNPVSEDIFQITDADILDDVSLQLIASIYNRKTTSYEALKRNLTNKLWGVSALGIPAINTLINGYE